MFDFSSCFFVAFGYFLSGCGLILLFIAGLHLLSLQQNLVRSLALLLLTSSVLTDISIFHLLSARSGLILHLFSHAVSVRIDKSSTSIPVF